MFSVLRHCTIAVRFIQSHKRGALASALTGLMMVASFVATTNMWQSEMPRVQIRKINYAVRIVRAHRHHAATTPISKQDGIPVSKRATRTVRTPIAKRSSVKLTVKQASLIRDLGRYLRSIGESAVVTSGARSPEEQLAIIKSKIRALGANRRFPRLRKATVRDVRSWLPAWEYLHALHVPVYAPLETKSTLTTTSNHLKGLAVDLISGSLSRLRFNVLAFMHSNFARRAALRVVSVAEEPGCVHVNLSPNTKRGG